MKKQIFLSAILLGACTLVVNAQTQPSTASATTANAIQEKKEIKAADLPETVKKTLAGDDYKGWEVSKAFVANDVYEVELKKGTEAKTFKFDKDGKVIK